MELGQTEDRWGQTVSLSEADWAHILEGHAELVHDRAIVLATVADPDLVMRDAKHENRKNFYRIVDWKADGTPRRFSKSA